MKWRHDSHSINYGAVRDLTQHAKTDWFHEVFTYILGFVFNESKKPKKQKNRKRKEDEEKEEIIFGFAHAQ